MPLNSRLHDTVGMVRRRWWWWRWWWCWYGAITVAVGSFQSVFFPSFILSAFQTAFVYEMKLAIRHWPAAVYRLIYKTMPKVNHATDVLSFSISIRMVKISGNIFLVSNRPPRGRWTWVWKVSRRWEPPQNIADCTQMRVFNATSRTIRNESQTSCRRHHRVEDVSTLLFWFDCSPLQDDYDDGDDCHPSYFDAHGIPIECALTIQFTECTLNNITVLITIISVG